MLVIVVSIVTRTWRSTELRFDGFEFADKVSEHEWQRLKAADYPILIPLRPGMRDLKEKEIEVRLRHRIPGTGCSRDPTRRLTTPHAEITGR